eukprot:gene9109-10082_t
MADIVKTLYSYESDQGHGLSFEAGVKINVTERGDNGWWRGNLLNNNNNDGNDNDNSEFHGWFPASYVTEIEPAKIQDESPAKSIPSPLPENWKIAQATDGQTYYYNEATNETSWSFPQISSPDITLPGTYAKRHTISQCSNLKKSPLHALKAEHASNDKLEGRTSSLSITPESGSTRTLSPARESLDAKSVGSTGSGGNRRRAPFFNFPSIVESKEQTALNQLEVSFCDNFWEDLGESTGFDIAKEFVTKGKANCKEMAEFFRERAAIEDLYAKNLARLAHSGHGSQEKGSYGETWQKIKKGVEEEAKNHQKFASSLLNGLVKTISEFAERPVLQEKKDSKRIDILIQEHRKRVASKFKEVEKQQGILAERQAKINQPNKKQDSSKTQKKIASSVDDLKKSIDDFNDAQAKWIENTIFGLVELEKRETERIEFLKMKLELYTEILKTALNANVEVQGRITEEIKKVDPYLDRKAFVEGNKTGSIRPVDIKK